jgi:hypothetical protein
VFNRGSGSSDLLRNQSHSTRTPTGPGDSALCRFSCAAVSPPPTPPYIFRPRKSRQFPTFTPSRLLKPLMQVAFPPLTQSPITNATLFEQQRGITDSRQNCLSLVGIPVCAHDCFLSTLMIMEKIVHGGPSILGRTQGPYLRLLRSKFGADQWPTV